MTVRQMPKPSRCGKRRKMRWPDEHAATRAAERASQQRGQHLEVYACGHCDGWHLTSAEFRPNG